VNIPQRCRCERHNGDFIMYARGLMHAMGGGVAEAEDARRGGRGDGNTAWHTRGANVSDIRGIASYSYTSNRRGENKVVNKVVVSKRTIRIILNRGNSRKSQVLKGRSE